MHEKPILVIHPNDQTTSFLDKIKHHLIENFGEMVHHFNIYPNENSHQSCLERISVHPEEGLIIFLGHGRTDRLYGSKGDLYMYSDSVGQEAKEENPDAFYFNENFIYEGNIDVFKNKKVFCLACNSNDKIANFAIEKGATSFLGFGNIPTSEEEFHDEGVKASGDVVRIMKTELNYIIKRSLVFSIQKKSTFKDLLNTIKFITNQRIADILIHQKHFKERYILTDYLYYLKRQALIFGEHHLKLLDY